MEKYEIHGSKGGAACRQAWKAGTSQNPSKELPEGVRQVLLYGSDEVIPMVFTDKNGDSEYNGHYIGLYPLAGKTSK